MSEVASPRLDSVHPFTACCHHPSSHATPSLLSVVPFIRWHSPPTDTSPAHALATSAPSPPRATCDQQGRARTREHPVQGQRLALIRPDARHRRRPRKREHAEPRPPAPDSDLQSVAADVQVSRSRGFADAATRTIAIRRRLGWSHSLCPQDWARSLDADSYAPPPCSHSYPYTPVDRCHYSYFRPAWLSTQWKHSLSHHRVVGATSAKLNIDIGAN